MRLTAQLCAVVATAMGVVVATEHMEARKVRDIVSPPLPEETTTHVRNHRVSSETQGQQWVRQNIYSRHSTQEEADRSASYWANQRLRGRYHSPGRGPETRNLHTVAAARHESMALHPMKIDRSGSLTVRNSAHDPSHESKTTTTEDERFSSRVHQVGLQTSTNEESMPPDVMDRLHRHPPRRTDEIPSRSHDDAWVVHRSSVPGRREQAHSASLATRNRPGERPGHHRYQVPDTLLRLRDPATEITRNFHGEPDTAGEHVRTQNGFSDLSDEVSSNMQQRMDQPEHCCGSKVPFDARSARPTGAFQRVASAGSIKVVQLPAQNSFPPSEVRDLQAAPLDSHTISLTWTTPGGNLDSGTASGYIIRLSEARRNLHESQFDEAPEETLLETSETLTAAGVYQTAGTVVGVEVPLARGLQQGHVYYVALKALDNHGHSSGVSNVAWFTFPASSTTAAHDQTTTAVHTTHPHTGEAPVTTTTHGILHTNGEEPLFSERALAQPPAPGYNVVTGFDTTTLATREAGGGANMEVQSVLSTPTAPISDPSSAQESGKRRKDRRKKKKKKSKRRKKGGRRNGRRRDSRQRGDTSTSAQDIEECVPAQPTLHSEHEEQEPVSLCDAQYSLVLAITYFTQNNEHQYLDYLSAALHTLQQKMQPSWRMQSQIQRRGRRGVPASMLEQNP